MIRKNTVEIFKDWGLSVLPLHLPLLENDLRLRSEDEIIDRILIMEACAAVAFGFDKILAQNWIIEQKITAEFSSAEVNFLWGNHRTKEKGLFIDQIESIWALMWVGGFMQEINVLDNCSDSLITLLPDLEANQSSEMFRSKIKLRPYQEILQMLDIYYCLNWAIHDAFLHKNRDFPLKTSYPMVLARRKALEWVLSDKGWEDISLDT
jgi:hypothetical protein